MNVCPRCSGAIMPAGIAYGYAGPVCMCGWQNSRIEAPLATDEMRAKWIGDALAENAALRAENERLKAIAVPAVLPANEIARLRYENERLKDAMEFAIAYIEEREDWIGRDSLLKGMRKDAGLPPDGSATANFPHGSMGEEVEG